MKDRNWQSIWQQAQMAPYQRAILCLMLLNGMDIKQIVTLPNATVDLDSGWLKTSDGLTFPLVRQSVEALTALYIHVAEPDSEHISAACREFAMLETDAHRRLSGALWITNDELRVMLETTRSTETPILPLRFTFPFSIMDRLQPYERSVVAENARNVLQAGADWLVEHSLTSQRSSLHRLFRVLRQGSLIFLVASMGVSGLNLVHNVLMGRLLSPADYSQLTFVITLQLLIGLLPSGIQTVAARFTARYQAHDEISHLRTFIKTIGRFGWLAGAITTIALVIVSPLLVGLFQLNSFAVLLPIILVIPFFIRTGADRGILQGLGAYFWLSTAYLAEGIIRLVASVLLGYALVSVGRSLEGAVWGLAQSMLMTWFIGWLAIRHFGQQADATSIEETEEKAEWIKLGWMTALVLIAQALITNSDFLLVKNFFSPEDAGLYAAVSVLGRIVYFSALPLTMLLVPMISRRQALDQPTRPILIVLVGGGVIVCSLLILGAALFGSNILTILYGTAYVDAAPLLAPYALAASLYTLTNLVITYQIALGRGGETWMPIVAGSAQVIMILLLHASLAQVITVQIALMGLLFATVLWRVLRLPIIRNDVKLFTSQAEG